MSTGKHVLVVDDEADLVDLLVLNLQRAGYETTVARDGREAIAAIGERVPDAVVLDIMMPELSGTEVAGRIRSDPTTARLPIIMLTAKGEEVDEIVGLTVGADDYITKPFSMKVLLARLEALLRRTGAAQPSSATTIRLGSLEIDPDAHEVYVDGKQIRLTLTEFRLLHALVEKRGKVLSRQALIGKAIGPGITVTERTIDVHVTSVRKKLGDRAELIQTVRGVGYRAVDPANAEGESVRARED